MAKKNQKIAKVKYAFGKKQLKGKTLFKLPIESMLYFGDKEYNKVISDMNMKSNEAVILDDEVIMGGITFTPNDIQQSVKDVVNMLYYQELRYRIRKRIPLLDKQQMSFIIDEIRMFLTEEINKLLNEKDITNAKQ